MSAGIEQCKKIPFYPFLWHHPLMIQLSFGDIRVKHLQSTVFEVWVLKFCLNLQGYAVLRKSLAPLWYFSECRLIAQFSCIEKRAKAVASVGQGSLRLQTSKFQLNYDFALKNFRLVLPIHIAQWGGIGSGAVFLFLVTLGFLEIRNYETLRLQKKHWLILRNFVIPIVLVYSYICIVGLNSDVSFKIRDTELIIFKKDFD